MKVKIKNFEQTILEIHESIIGNRKAHFEIETINKAKSQGVSIF